MKTVDFTQHLLNVQSELFRFAFKLTADREEANDLLQETSLKALDNEEKFTPDTNFKGWMYTIMRNIFINNYRKTVRIIRKSKFPPNPERSVQFSGKRTKRSVQKKGCTQHL